MEEFDLQRLVDYLGAPGGQLAYGTPPFAFGLEAPPQFHVFHTEPGALRKDVERACRSADGWRTLDAATQTSVRRTLTDTVHQAARAGVLLTVMATGGRADGRGISVVTMTLSWMRVRPFEADLDFAHLAAGADGHVREHQGAVGTCVLTADVNDTGPDGASLPGGSGRSYDVQSFVPVTGTEWMAIVSGSTGEEARAEALERAVERMAASIRPDPEQLEELRGSASTEAREEFSALLGALGGEER